MKYYLDSTALVAMLKFEKRTADLLSVIDGHEIVSSELAFTELQRILIDAGLPLNAVAPLREVVTTFSLEQSVLNLAAMLPVRDARTIDVLHIATALSAAVDGFISFDAAQVGAATAAGLRAIQI
jgi:predicted nucleic acid-binding protein